MVYQAVQTGSLAAFDGKTHQLFAWPQSDWAPVKSVKQVEVHQGSCSNPTKTCFPNVQNLWPVSRALCGQWSPSHGQMRSSNNLRRAGILLSRDLSLKPRDSALMINPPDGIALHCVDGICGDENENRYIRIMWSASKNVMAWRKGIGINTHGETTSCKSGIIKMQMQMSESSFNSVANGGFCCQRRLIVLEFWLFSLVFSTIALC